VAAIHTLFPTKGHEFDPDELEGKELDGLGVSRHCKVDWICFES